MVSVLLSTVALALVLAAVSSGSTPRAAAFTTAAGPFVSGEVLVQFKPGAAANARAAAHSQAGGSPRDEIARTSVQLVSVAPGREDAAINAYLRNPNVLTAQPNYLFSIIEPVSHGAGTEVMPGDYYFDEQWALHNTGQLFQCVPWPFGGELCWYIGTPDADIDAPEGWAISTGAGIKIAVVDTGVDYTHPDLTGRYIGGYDFQNNDNDPMDDMFHGTHVAGIAAASMNNTTGNPPNEEGVAGVAPQAQILAYKVCDSEGQCNDFAIQQGIAAAVTAGAKVINISLGGPTDSGLLGNAIQDAWEAGLVIVAAAGNNGNTNLVYPAALPNVVSVAAFDEDHLRASFSTYGNWVAMSAPGNVIMGAVPAALCGGIVGGPGDIGCYDWLSGTSMASPHVAGAAALLFSRGATSNTQVVNYLFQGAEADGVSSIPLDSWTIHGGLNIHDSLSLIGPAPTPTNTPLPPTPTSTPLPPTPTATATPPTTDTVVVTKVSYNSRRDELKIEATSSGAPGAILTAFDITDPSSPKVIGPLTYSSKRKVYSGTFSRPASPGGVQVVSSLGGSDTW